jgi:hypothetical protein
MTNLQRLLNYYIFQESSNGLDYINSNYIANYMDEELYFFDDIYVISVRY